ncbi:MAG: M61 family metallopeptidase [Planctomycetota bacterium]|jgi:predicted metalloprotease with PDZ domain
MKHLLVLLLACGLAADGSAQTPFDLTGVDWTISPDADGESQHLKMVLAPLHERERMILRIPLWRPGSYNYSSYQDRLSGMSAYDQDGNPVELQPLDDRSWQLHTSGVTSLTVEYDLAVRNQALPDRTPAYFLHGPATFLWLEGAKDLPHYLHLDLPPDWGFASGHRPYPGADNTWYSPNYDVFVDCPMAFGELETHTFTLHDKPFEVVLFGRVPTEAQFDRADWVERVKAISDAAYDLFGDYPFERYVYLYQFSRIGGYSGLEHLNSTTIDVSARMVANGDIGPLESVTAHEFFHLWNVKRIRPAALGPFDYTKSAHTRDLWWMEGVTSYYNDILLQRAGLRAEQEDWFTRSQLQNRRALEFSQGYGKVAPERASWRVWSEDSNVSYYDQGQALGWLLDIQIRHHSGNTRSLDDVVRALHRWVDYPGPGLRPGDLERMIRAVSGWDPAEFFDLYIAGNHTFPFAEVLPLAGYRVTEMFSGDPYLGIRIEPDMRIAQAGDPFLESDVLLTIDGRPMPDLDAVRGIIPELVPGALVELGLGDGKGSTRKVAWTIKERDRDLFRASPLEDMTARQRAIHDGILEGTLGP